MELMLIEVFIRIVSIEVKEYCDFCNSTFQSFKQKKSNYVYTTRTMDGWVTLAGMVIITFVRMFKKGGKLVVES